MLVFDQYRKQAVWNIICVILENISFSGVSYASSAWHVQKKKKQLCAFRAIFSYGVVRKLLRHTNISLSKRRILEKIDVNLKKKSNN